MRLLAPLTLCAAVHALAPPPRNARTQLQPRPAPALSNRRCRASVWTLGAFSHAWRGGPKPRARGVLWSSPDGSDGPRRRTGGILRSSPDDLDDDVPGASSDADFGGAVINAVTAVLGVAVAISTVCNLAGYGFMQTDEGLYFGTIQQTRMRYQLDQEAGRAR